MPALRTPKVVIAGAGPAGIATALYLLKRSPELAGRILVVDRARFPRDKPCGGGLTGHAAQALAELDLPIPVACVPADTALVRFGAFEREIKLAAPVAVIRRWDFDAALVSCAEQRGVEVQTGCAAQAYEVDAQGITLHTNTGAIRASVLVGADGTGGVVRKQLFDDRIGKRRLKSRPIRLFRAEIAADQGRFRRTMLYDFSPMVAGLRGYLWIFPMPSGALNVGLMHYPSSDASGSGKQLVKLLDEWLRPHGLRLDGRERGWPVFGYDTRLPLARPRVLLVGDAAGVDALTGEGIAVGMEHGAVAADTIADALLRDDFSLRNYTGSIRRAAVGRELQLDGRLAKMLYDGDSYRRWLSLVLFDEKMLRLYADRVAGQIVLADQRAALAGALGRHMWNWRSRRKQLEDIAPLGLAG